jgi:hypothetical protein
MDFATVNKHVCLFDWFFDQSCQREKNDKKGNWQLQTRCTVDRDLMWVWGMKKKSFKVHWVLDSAALAQLRDCKDCKSEPTVFLTAKKVPCCRFIQLECNHYPLENARAKIYLDRLQKNRQKRGISY